MKKLLSVLAVCILCGCANKTQQAQDCAQGFLDAFLANDFNAAAAFCSEDFNVDFSKAMADFDKLDTSVKTMLVEQCSKLKANISSTRRVNESDTFIVSYTIVNCAADSSAKELVLSELKVVDGKVVSLNK
jgi:hypothetical protein